MQDKALALIGAEVGEGASDPGCKWGARALRERGLAEFLARPERPAGWSSMVRARSAQSAAERLDAVAAFSSRLAQAVTRALRRGDLPVVIGGDHSCAVGTWSAVAQAHRPGGPIGLIWVDAHLDAHTPATSHTQAPHGMPVAALLGHGASALAGLYGWLGKIRPEHLVIVGARSYEAGEKALLERLGVRIMYMPEVQRRGFGACMEEAMQRVRRATSAWGLSFDLDALDPVDAPGTGTPVESGIGLQAALDALRDCARQPGCAALELVEYNPAHDVDGRTALASFALLDAATPSSTAPLQRLVA
ncbi:arginase [Variovorax dokdonensis]|uniref:Arginase n=1 Tax=Variovorax dokdonensis TaxID=344883 RepID=A0ABT7NA91_9BURK|nr:arginase [Variovorax dokdonensis]MDM0044857.1 arginase [Variovorax dokdonensis]